MPPTTPLTPETSFLAGGGEMGERMRSHRWEDTLLGPPAQWRPSLKTMVRMALTTRHPIFIFWGDELFGFYNDAYSESLGPEKHPALLGMPGRQAFPEIWHIIGPQIEMVLRGDGATWNENHLVPFLRGGRLEDVYWTYSYGPIDDPEAPHGVGGVLVICTETTRQVLNERRLAHEHERFQELFEQAPTFMAVLRGPEHRFALVNPGYQRLVHGRDVIGVTVAEALPEAVAQGYLTVLDEVYRSGKAYRATNARFSLSAEPGDAKEERFLDFVYQPMRDAAGVVTGIFVEGADVTERLEAEKRLQRTEERLHLALDSSQAGTFDIDLLTGNVTLSPRAMQHYGVGAESVSVRACLEMIPEEEHASVRAAINAVRSPASDGSYRVRHRVKHRDGNTVWLNVVGSISREPLADGTPAERLTGVLWDVTEQQNLVEQLRQSDRRKDEFLATLAHELRNPLAPIRTAAHLLGRPDLAPERVAECSRIIQRQTRTMALLLDDLLEVSRITSGKLVLRCEPVAVNTIVESALEATRSVLQAKGHELALTLPEPMPWLNADALRLSQVLVNLLNNAIKYTDRGGRLALQVRPNWGKVEIDIADNGIGLELESRPRLFEMFQQVRGQLDRSDGGLGIGLALSKGLVELHGGRLEAFSEGLGHGSTFRVTLPAIVQPELASTSLAAPASTGAVQRRRLLVADDNVDAAHSMAMTLEAEGHEVLLAHDGLSALAVAERQRPDAALLDIGMPGLDGYQLAARLRATDFGGAMLLVAMTGWGQRTDKRLASQAGFDVHMTKPVSIQAVLALLAQRPGGG